ncbi:MAG TPA: hypothetical protein VGL81_10750 [Polyangiaceae bacterium]|jgi:hypothetical protein
MPVDLLAEAKPALKAFAKAQNLPLVMRSTVDPTDPKIVQALQQAAHQLDGICPGECQPSCWEMARTVTILMPDGTEVVGALFWQCQCVDSLGTPCPDPAAGAQ